MTLDELERTMPNGFHDAWIRRIEIDYRAQRVSMLASLLVGVPDDPPEQRSRYRDAEVIIEGVQFLVIEPPKPGRLGEVKNESRRRKEGIWVDTFPPDSPPEVAKELPGDCFVAAFYVDEIGRAHV